MFQGGNQCFCGSLDDNYARAGKVDDGCDIPCKGSSETCGGDWQNHVFIAGNEI